MSPIRVLVVDDHPVVRKGIQMYIGTEPTIELVGEAKDGASAVLQVKRLQPDVVIMDLFMPHKDGVTAIAEIKRDFPQVKIIVLTTFEHNDRINAAIEAGADGYLLKDADGEALIEAIKTARHGEMMPLDCRVARRLLHDAIGQAAPNQLVRLTEREHEVLDLLAKGLSNKAIAEALSLAEGTIKIYVSRILSKLRVSSRTEAALHSIRLGLVTGNGHSKSSADHLT